MKRPVASAKPNSSVVLISDCRTWRRKYHVFNKPFVVYEDRDTGETKTRIVNRTTGGEMLNVWDLARKQYRRAIRIFRENIDGILSKRYSDKVVYRDCDISDILAIITQKGSEDDVALTIFNFIEGKNNGNSSKETSKEEFGIEITSIRL